MPRKRKPSLSSALMKAMMPGPVRRKRVRRPKPPTISVAKTVRAVNRAAPKIAAAATAMPKATARPASGSRKPPSRKPASRTTARPKSAGRKPAAPAPASIGKGTWRQARFTGAAGSRSYRVYIPRGLRKTTKAPLVLALHGCTQNALDFAAGTRFNKLADKHHFVVVYRNNR